MEHISSRLADLPLFRFDIDSWSDYRWEISPEGFTLQDQAGRSCSDHEINAVYLKGILPDDIQLLREVDDEEIRQEVLQLWLGLRDWAHEAGKLALARPSFRGSWTRIRQLHIAKDLFPIPDWRIRHGIPDSGLWLGDHASPPIKRPDSVSFFRQDLSDATHSVVIIWVDGKCYSYELKRHPNEENHSRSAPHETWKKSVIFDEEKMRVSEMMKLMGLDYARLDFIRVHGGKLYFLGLNPYGHFLSHDSVECDDILDAIAGSIRRVWQLNQDRDKWQIQ